MSTGPRKKFSRKRESSDERLGGTRLRTRALDLLSRRDHSELELKRKLLKKGGHAEEIVPLLEEFRSRGYLDDQRFAENFVQARLRKAWGRQRYRQELMTRGITKEVISSILERIDEMGSETQAEKLRRLVLKDLQKGREGHKIVASLLRRGFSSGLVREIYRECSASQTESFEL